MTAISVLKQTVGGFTETIRDRVARVGLTVVTLLVVIWFLFQSLFNPLSGANTKTKILDLITGSVQATDVYNTATMKVSANVSIEKVAKVLKIPRGKTKLVYGAIGQVQAGLHAQDIEVKELDIANRTVELLFPVINITDVHIDTKESEILANYRNWFGPKAGVDIYDQAQKEAVRVMTEKACTDEILAAAQHNARAQVTNLLTEVGFEHVTIDFVEVDKTSCPAL